MNIIRFTPNGQNRTSEVVEALAHAPAGTLVQFEKGRYDFYAEGTYEDIFYPTCNRNGTKKVVFPLLRLKDITIDGGGSEFMFHDRIFPFIVQNCKNITFRNFSIDFSFPRSCVCDILENTPGGMLVDLDSSGCEYGVNAEGNLWIRAGSTVFSTCESVFSCHQPTPRGRRHAYIVAGEHYYECVNMPDTVYYCNAEKTDRGVLLRWDDPDMRPGFEPGKLIFLIDERRHNDVFFLDRSDDTLIEDVRIYQAAGMGVVAQLCNNIRLHRYTNAPREGGLFSTTADNFLLSNCTGLVEMDECRVERPMDDVLNVHGIYTAVQRITAPNKVTVKAGYVSLHGVNPYFPGDVLLVSDGTTHRQTGTVTVKSSRVDDDPGLIFLEFEEEIRGRIKVGDYLENACRMPEVSVTNCYFSDFPVIRLSSSRPTRFENNTLVNCAGILLNDLIGYWSISGPMSHVTIANNTFRNIGTAVRTVLERAKGSDVRPSFISVTGNRFENCDCLLDAEDVSILTFQDNTWDRGCVKLRGCSSASVQAIEGAENAHPNQLLMQWTPAPVEIPALPEGYSVHRHRRGGDEVLSEAAYREGYLRLVFPGKPCTEGNFRWLYDDMRIPDDGFMTVLDRDNRVVACASVQMGEHTPDSATLHMVYADINLRGLGLGKAVTMAAMQYMYESGVGKAFLTSDEFRSAAVGIYLKYGYLPVLSDPSMRGRWNAVLDRLGIENTMVIDEKGELSPLKER